MTSLKEYNKKRNFSSTNEPKGKLKNEKAKRFVVQYHQARAKHYDFRLEYNGVLLSWAVPKGLSQNPKDKRLAVMVESHPVDYINFEGIIPKGNYGAGSVEIFDEGEYLPIHDFGKSLKKGHLKFVLNGKKLKGGWSLIKTQNDNWLIVKINDEFVNTKKAKSTKLPFQTCSAQLATLTKKIPNGKDWIFEIKYDGYRIISFVENGKAKMVTRNNIDYTKNFKTIAEKLNKIEQENFVVDGEIVSFDKNGKSDFSLLQDNIKSGKSNFFYVVFDLLVLNGQDLRHLPLKDRKAKLERLLHRTDDCVIFSSHVDNGKESFSFAKANNLEGIIAKKTTSLYSGTRGADWLKIKCYNRQEFVIAGYTTSEKNQLLSSLILGYYQNNKLKFAGKVGTGFSDKTKFELLKTFKQLIKKTCPFLEKQKIKNCIWLSPKLVVEIQFAEFTKDNILRQPSFIALRKDKDAKDVKLEGDYANQNNQS